MHLGLLPVGLFKNFPLLTTAGLFLGIAGYFKMIELLFKELTFLLTCKLLLTF